MYQQNAAHNAIVDSTASPKWTWVSDGQINGGLAVVDGHVFLDTFSKKVAAIDLKSGKTEWQSSFDNILMSTPVVSHGIVVVGSGHNGRIDSAMSDNPYPYAGDARPTAIWGRAEGDHVFGIDAATGQKRWSFPTTGEDMPSPAVVGGVAVFANGDKHLYSIAVTDGSLNWQQEVDGLGTMASTASLSRNAITSVCNDGPYRCHTLAVDAQSGRVAWDSSFGNSDSSPAIGGGSVFVSGLENESVQSNSGITIIAALEASTGRLRWRYKSERGYFTELGSNERAVAGTYADGMYFQSIPPRDEFVALNANNGRVQWKFHSMGPIKMSCVVRGGKVYVGDTVGMLYVLDESSGKVLATRAFKTPFTVSPPVIVGKSILVAASTSVYAIPLAEIGREKRMQKFANAQTP